MRPLACRRCRRRQGIEKLKGFCVSCHSELRHAKAGEKHRSIRDEKQEMQAMVVVRPSKEHQAIALQRIDHRHQNRVQLLADFLSTYYPAASSRHQSPSWLLALPKLDLSSSPVLGSSVDTIALAHLAIKRRNDTLLHHARETYSWVLNMVIRRIANPNRKKTQAEQRDLVMSALLVGLCEDAIMGRPEEDDSCSYTKHLLGVKQFLALSSPTSLDLSQELDHKLFQNMRVACLFVSLSNRQNFKLGVSDRSWGPPPEDISVGNGLTMWYPLIVPLPGLLERVDRELWRRHPDWENLAHVYEDLEKVKRNVLHWLHHEAYLCQTPLEIVRITDDDAFDWEIEEHCFITSFTNPPILSFYKFVDAQHGMRYTTSWLVSLVVDCTLLRILHANPDPQYFPNARQAARKIEEDAFKYAEKICQCVYFYSNVPSLGYGRFMNVLLKSAKAFFEEAGAMGHVNWCQCSMIALDLRLRRLRTEGYHSLCKVGALGNNISEGLRYHHFIYMGKSFAASACPMAVRSVEVPSVPVG